MHSVWSPAVEVVSFTHRCGGQYTPVIKVIVWVYAQHTSWFDLCIGSNWIWY